MLPHANKSKQDSHKTKESKNVGQVSGLLIKIPAVYNNSKRRRLKI